MWEKSIRFLFDGVVFQSLFCAVNVCVCVCVDWQALSEGRHVVVSSCQSLIPAVSSDWLRSTWWFISRLCIVIISHSYSISLLVCRLLSVSASYQQLLAASTETSVCVCVCVCVCVSVCVFVSVCVSVPVSVCTETMLRFCCVSTLHQRHCKLLASPAACVSVCMFICVCMSSSICNCLSLIISNSF